MKTASFALFAAAVLFASAAGASTTAYQGCSFAWDYPDAVEYHAGFELTIDGLSDPIVIASDQRKIACDATPLKTAKFGAYTARLIAIAEEPAVNSDPATLEFTYMARPKLLPPGLFKLLWFRF
jgi:hypothetical protein